MLCYRLNELLLSNTISMFVFNMVNTFFIVVLRHFLNLYLYAIARWVVFSVGTFVEVRRQIEKICSSSALMIPSIKVRLLELDVSRLTSRAILLVFYWFWGMVLYNTYLLWTHCGYRDFFSSFFKMVVRITNVWHHALF